MSDGGRRIVVADDNIWMASSLKVLLELWGNNVTIAADGLAALAAICDLRPEVALVDLRMPKLDGLEVARRVRAETGPSAVLLLAVTGSADPSDCMLTRAAGFDAHLVKPIDLQILRSLLLGKDKERGQPPGRAASSVGRRTAF